MKNKTTLLYSIILLTLFSCSKTNEVDLLNQRVDELINTIEKHNLENFSDFLANDFSVARRFNKTQFFIFIRHQLKRNKTISISILDKNIILTENYADITANLLLLGSNDWIPERGQLYKIASRWQKENGDWVMSRLRWEISEI